MTLTVERPFCVQGGCPFGETGECLEGFSDPADCPQYRRDAGVAAPAIDDGDGADDTDIRELDSMSAPVYIGGDRGLSITESNAVTGADDALVILIAGEHKSGKTTLVLELFARFLEATFGDWTFAGSKTLNALDRFHKPARLSSGRATATTARTQADDMRLLHLRLSKDARRLSVLFSDVRGEFFEDVANGADVAEAVPIAQRADLCAIVLDGAKLGEASSREQAFWRAKMLIGGLTESGGLAVGTPTSLVISKVDRLSATQVRDAQEELADLMEFARTRGLVPEPLLLSARPDTGRERRGLIELLAWVTARRNARPSGSSREPLESDRYFLRPSRGSS